MRVSRRRMRTPVQGHAGAVGAEPDRRRWRRGCDWIDQAETVFRPDVQRAGGASMPQAARSTASHRSRRPSACSFRHHSSHRDAPELELTYPEDLTIVPTASRTSCGRAGPSCSTRAAGVHPGRGPHSWCDRAHSRRGHGIASPTGTALGMEGHDSRICTSAAAGAGERLQGTPCPRLERRTRGNCGRVVTNIVVVSELERLGEPSKARCRHAEANSPTPRPGFAEEAERARPRTAACRVALATPAAALRRSHREGKNQRQSLYPHASRLTIRRTRHAEACRGCEQGAGSTRQDVAQRATIERRAEDIAADRSGLEPQRTIVNSTSLRTLFSPQPSSLPRQLISFDCASICRQCQ